MNVKATATFTGRDLLGRFVESKVTPGIRAGIGQWQRLIRDEAKLLVPVDTGELRDSIEVQEVEDTGKTVRGAVVASAPHASFVEYGTGARGAASPGAGPYTYNMAWPGMRAQPYLRPASDHVKEDGRAWLINEIAARVK